MSRRRPLLPTDERVREWVYRGVLLVAFAVAITLRIPATHQELPPFQFCDESIFSAETQRMLVDQDWVTKEFRSGGFNIYPVLLIGRLLGLQVAQDPTSLVVAGRWFYDVVLASAAIFLLAGSARVLTGRRAAGVLGAGLYLLSPSLLAVSRYWYPDHYAVLFSAALVHLLVLLLRRRATAAGRLLLVVGIGAVLGAALGVKYTFVVALLPVGLALAAQLITRRDQPLWRRLVRLATEAVIASGVVTAVAVGVNFSALIDRSGFVAGFNFNVSNYGRPGGSPEGVLFYAFLLFVAAFGVLGVAGLIVGFIRVGRTTPIILIVLLSFPLANVVYLGVQGLVFNRNIVASIPFVIPIMAAGVAALIGKRSRSPHPKLRVVAIGGIVLAASLQVVQVVPDFVHDLAPDSQPLAEAWIAKNVPVEATVGINPSCSLSPAQAAGRTVQIDPGMERGFPYYVLNSYWDSALNGAFRGPAAVWSIFDQKYLHYTYADDRSLPIDVFTLPWRRVPVREVVPSGYEVLKTFDSNGPTIVVLRRIP